MGLAACNNGPITIDVVTRPNAVMVFAANDEDCDRVKFLQPGECAGFTDVSVNPCTPRSCLERIAVDGSVAETSTGHVVGELFVVQTQLRADSLLEIRGCGIDFSTTFDGIDVPVPTVSAAKAATGTQVSWTTEVPHASALVTITNMLFGETCHVVGDSHEFNRSIGGTLEADVQTFAEPETFMQGKDTIRLWRGAGASATVVEN